MGVLTERPLLYSARPLVFVGGREQPAVGAAVLSLAVRESIDGLFTLEATLGNWGAGSSGSVGYLYFDRALLDFGTEIAVQLGAGDALGQVFRGRITALEGRFSEQRVPEIALLAEDRLQNLRMTRRTRSFERSGIDEIVRQVCSDHGLDTDIDIESQQLQSVAQLNQSDLAFLRQLAAHADADLWIEADKLWFKARTRLSGTPVSLAYGQTLHEMQIGADLAHQHTTVIVAGWDVAAKQALAESADDALVQAELDGGSSGASVLSAKFGARVEHVVHEAPFTATEAQARAAARFRAQARRFVRGRGTCEGDARVRVGRRVALEGVGPLFAGNYLVTQTHHRFDYQSGYRTTFEVERAGLGNP